MYKRSNFVCRTTKIALFLRRHFWMYYILNYTWGIVMTSVGLLVTIFMLLTGHRPRRYNGAYYFISRLEGGWGVEFGKMFIIAKDCNIKSVKDAYILKHELGHTYQNAIFGPFMLFISIASIIRFWYREIKGDKITTDYDDIWFEDSATYIGKSVVLYSESKRGLEKK